MWKSMGPVCKHIAKICRDEAGPTESCAWPPVVIWASEICKLIKLHFCGGASFLQCTCLSKPRKRPYNWWISMYICTMRGRNSACRLSRLVACEGRSHVNRITVKAQAMSIAFEAFAVAQNWSNPEIAHSPQHTSRREHTWWGVWS